MILTCIIIALAAGGAATTVGKSRIFSGLRWRIHDRSTHGRYDWRWELLNAFVTCPYCIAHWIVIAFAAWYQPRLVHSDLPVLDVLVTALATISVAAAVAAVMCRAYKFGGPDATNDQ